MSHPETAGLVDAKGGQLLDAKDYSDDDIDGAPPGPPTPSVASLLGAVDSTHDASPPAEEEDSAAPDRSPFDSCLDLISGHLPDSLSRGPMLTGLGKLPKSKRNLLANLQQLEDAQKMRYYDEIVAILRLQGMFPDLTSFTGVDVLDKKAAEFISHRCISSFSASHVFQAAVTGPPKSGKTSYLGILTEKLLFSLITADTWKRTFIFGADLTKLFRVVDDLKLLYRTFIRQLFALFNAQTPQLIQFLPLLEQSFLSIVDATTKPGSFSVPRKMVQQHSYKHVADEIQRLGQRLIEAWFDPTALLPWLTFLMMLPVDLANAFGFNEVVFFLDHFDFALVQLFPVYPFEDSKGIAYISEHLKIVMQNCCYILTARDSDMLFASLRSVSESGIDLAASTEFITLFDCLEASRYKESEVLIEFNDTRQSIRVDSQCAGGVPSYIAKWERLIEVIDELEKSDPSSFEFQETYGLMIADAEVLLQTVFVDERDPDQEIVHNGLGVDSVRRIKGRI
jgi:hypothetical protein